MAYAAPNKKIYDSREEYLKDIGWTGGAGGPMHSPSDPSEHYPDLDTSIINSDDIRPREETDFKEPDVVPVYDVSKLDFNLTKPQQKEQSLTEQLQSLNKQLVGESEYRTEQEGKYGVEGLIAQQQDLANQLNMLQAEYKQIPIQIQEEFRGRGATAGGVAPIEASRLRKISIRALGVSAMLEASRGNLATAQELVDRAVAQKYNPIREEIKAKTANLQLIQESPEYTQAEKKRAMEQKAALKNREAEVDAREAEEKQVWSIATEAAKAGVDALTLQKIQNAGSKEEALRIAQEAGVFGAGEEFKTPTTKKFGDRWYQWDTSTGEWVDMGIVGGGKGTTFVDESTNKEYDFSTTSGLKAYLEDFPETTFEEMDAWIDQNMTMDATTRRNLLESAGFKPYKETQPISRSTILMAAREMKEADVENYFRARYADKELGKIAKDAGFGAWNKTSKTEIKEYLRSPKAREKLAKLLEEQYKGGGYEITD